MAKEWLGAQAYPLPPGGTDAEYWKRRCEQAESREHTKGVLLGALTKRNDELEGLTCYLQGDLERERARSWDGWSRLDTAVWLLKKKKKEEEGP